MEELDALHEWKAGGRGETMMSTFEYKSSHDKMFIEGYRFAKDIYFNEWYNLKENLDHVPKTGWYLVETFETSVKFRTLYYVHNINKWFYSEYNNSHANEYNLPIKKWKEIN